MAGSLGPPGGVTGGRGRSGAGRGPAGGAGTARGGGAGPAAPATGTAAARAIILCGYAADSIVVLFDPAFPGIYGGSAVGFPNSGKGPTTSITTP